MFGKLFSRLKDAERALDRSTGYDISTPEARKRAHRHFRYVDHGILRGFWTNLHEISPGVWRSNQPDRDRIKKYHEMGIRTVLNLRGTNRRSPYLFEEEACQEFGLKLISHGLAARSLVKRKTLLALLDTFETIKRPFVMHCKSGADRAGLAAVFYKLHIEKTSIKEARKQLSFKYLHIRASHTGILDHLMDVYEADNRQEQISIRDWIATRYDKDEIEMSYKSKKTPQ